MADCELVLGSTPDWHSICALAPDCGNFRLMAAGRCLALAQCSVAPREAVLATLPEQQRRRAEDAARIIFDAFRQKNPALLYTRPRPSDRECSALQPRRRG